MHVKFNQDTIYETEGRNKGPVFKAGEVHDFEDAFAMRWINLGVAEEVDKAEAEAKFKPVRVEKPAPAEPPPELTKAAADAKQDADAKAKAAAAQAKK